MKTSIVRSAVVAASVTALSVATLTGCTPSAGADSTLTELTIGVLPSVESAPLFLGQEEGFFEEQGLRIRVATLASGTAMMIDPVISGTYDIAASDMLSILRAQEAGDDLRLIAPAGSATGDTGKDFGALVVQEDSPITTVDDLTGKTVASNSLLDTNNTVLRAVMDKTSGLSYTVQWKEVPVQAADAALSEGTLDAAFLVEPYLTRALNGDKRVLSYAYSEFAPALDINAYFTSATFADERGDLLDRFRAALEKSINHASETPNAVRTVMSAYAETQWNERTGAVLPRYTTRFDVPSATRLAEAAMKYQMIKTMPDFEAILPD